MTHIQHIESHAGIADLRITISSFLNRSVIDEENRKRLPLLWRRL
ncbi:hypothetical protein ABIE17_001303 [Lelliottia nimipressuralis]